MLNSIKETEVRILAGDALLEGNLNIPENPRGIVLFIHGSGSSRLSPRNRHVAQLMNQAGLATLLFDLLTIDEHEVDITTMEYRFDIELLSQRTISAIQRIVQQPGLDKLPMGLFGASTGAAAALFAARALPDTIQTVVSRGGRPDLAMPALPELEIPTLFIVGSLDHEVIELNKMAQQQMSDNCELAIIPGATHLFEEPGTLDQVASTTIDWFLKTFS